ncbi:hypothetical protein [Aquimarina algiphila]|uniref:hypothetical protein n=1 Tax=Aquimarina algiphila TaxID=2047982 RepID=UPI00232CEA19|nr:hypothetical protein [Aquimarina algiphila]
MKQKLPKLTKVISLTIKAFILFLLTMSCANSNKNYDSKIEDSKKKKELAKPTPFIDDEDYTLTFDFSKKEKFQPVHLDLVNDFGILAKIKLENDSILKKIDIRLREVKNMKKYSLGKAEYLPSSIIDSSTQKKVHHLTIKLVPNIGNREKQVIAKLPNTNIVFRNNEIIDIHIDAEDLGFHKTELIFENDILTQTKKHILRDTTHFGDQQCISQIIGTLN